jgi:hypothetical protein
MARRKIRRRKRVMCIWDEVFASGLRHTPFTLTGTPRQEYVPFYAGLERVIFQTMMPIAEQIQMGHRFGPKHFISEGVYVKLNKNLCRYYARTANQAWRVRFRQIYTAIISLSKEHAPEHLRHAELLALCELNRWQTYRENLRTDEFIRNLLHKDGEDD